jgi:hypothetical protein
MKKILCNILFFVFVGFYISCETATDCCVPPPDSNQWLFGSWLLYERGYSPGAGYFTEPVDPEPPQTLKLRLDYTVKTTIPSLIAFKFYRILDDPNFDRKILALFPSDPGDQVLDLMNLDHSYIIESEDGTRIKLIFRFCFEGCHLGLKRFENND